MNHETIIEQLAVNIDSFRSLFSNIPQTLVHWQPAPGKWSIIEVVNHLYDEEREDFRYRLQSVLTDPDKPWPAIAPEEWVTQRAYATRNYETSVANFLHERQESVKWLRDLSSPDWQVSYNHPQMGAMSAEMILANWLAHDYLHIRQITALKYGYLRQEVQPVSLAYAGDW